MIFGLIFSTVLAAAAGFNIYTKPVRHFTDKDSLFGQTTIQSKNGVLVPSPKSRPQKVFSCALNDVCTEVNLPVSLDKGLNSVVSAANKLTKEKELIMICQQVRKQNGMIEDLNGDCSLLFDQPPQGQIQPAVLVVEQMKRNSNNNNNNHHQDEDKPITDSRAGVQRIKRQSSNNSENRDDDDDEDAGPEIAIVLDGSGSISPKDFESAKEFVINVFRNAWEICFNCKFAVVQYGKFARTELSLMESKNPQNAFEKVKKITQIGNWTVTATAINHVLEEVFVAENGSYLNSQKIMIVISDGEIFGDNMNLSDVLKSPKMENIVRYAIGVGEILYSKKGMKEMKEIASDPDEKHFFEVDNYSALTSLLSQLQQGITGIEGIQQGAAFHFELAETGFSSHITDDESQLFGAVGAYDWSGGVVLRSADKKTVTFLNGSTSGSKFSYLGYSVASVSGSSGTLYISGAPRYKLTGAVFVFHGTSHKLTLEGEQVGSYFGAVLCALKNQEVDYLLIGAPHFFQKGEEGKVYIYKLNQGTFEKQDWEWKGLDKYIFARFGSAIAVVGDLDGNGFNDVAVGAPLEVDDTSSSGSIYIYNAFPGGIQRHFSQRISATNIGMKLQYFGQSVSPFSYPPLNKQPYISVGSQGAVTILETLPVISFNPTFEIKPSSTIPMGRQINAQSDLYPLQMKICFNTGKDTIKAEETLLVRYQISLEAGREKKRLTFKDKSDTNSDTFSLQHDTECLSFINLHFKGCSDCFSPMEIRLNYTLTSSSDRPVRVLDSLSPTKVSTKIDFEKECREQGKCVANISLSDSKLSEDMIVIGHTQELNITFNLTNSGDATYMTTLVLTYPNILQFNKFKQMEGSFCQNEVKEDFSLLTCHLQRPVFQAHAQANFYISWQPVNTLPEMRVGNITANLTCENEGIKILDIKQYPFEVTTALKVQLTGQATPHVLTITENTKETKPLKFEFQLYGENRHNATLNVSISITVPTEHTTFKIQRAHPKNCMVVPKDQQKGKHVIECVATDVQKTIAIEGEATIRDVQGKSDKIVATATLNFDQERFQEINEIQKMAGDKGSAMQIEVMIRKLAVEKSTGAIIGGSIGGFLLLAIIIIILIKCGFFKRRHKMEEAGTH